MRPTASSSRGDKDSRFAELLQPVPDITKNWEIDISKLLEVYIKELASVNVDLQNGEFSLNFAQAALLIQGSAAIYGRKVEYFYSLVSQLLVNMNHEKKVQGATSTTTSRTRDNILERHLEFTDLDDLTVCNNLDETTGVVGKKYGVQKIPMIPLALVPLDTNEKGTVNLFNTRGEELGNKKDFQLNLCNMHSSGCLLLPATESNFFSDITNSADTSNSNIIDADDDDAECPQDPFPDEDMDDNIPVEAPPEQVNGYGSTLCNGNINQSASILFEHENLDVLNETTNNFQRRRSLRQILRQQKEIEEEQRKAKERQLLEKNPWETEGDLQPEMKIAIQKKAVKKLPARTKKRLSKNPGSEEEGKDNSVLAFCSKKFFSIESPHVKKGGAVNKLCMNDAFDELIAEQYSKQKIAMQSCRKRLKLEDDVDVKEEPAEPKEDPNGIPEEGDEDNDLGTHPLLDDNDADPDPDPDDDVNHADTDDINTNGNLDSDNFLATPSGDGMYSYEDHVQNCVASYMKDVAQFSRRTDISEKVNEWERRIKPVLEEENKREGYNIHMYGTRIIDKFGDNNRKQTLPFEDVCKGLPKWEVCRYFLASLQLVNNCNLGLDSSVRPDGMHNIELTLLSRKRHQEQLDKFGQGEH